MMGGRPAPGAMTQAEEPTIGTLSTLAKEQETAKDVVKAAEVERLGWLDVVRAIAVTATALMHLLEESSETARRVGNEFVSPGIYGIVLFFLVSGFVIPLTLERRGSLGAFAVARFFRLYPLYWFSLLLVMLLAGLKLAELSPDFATGLPQSFWWNATMAQSWVGQPDAVGLYWTLGFELGFYVVSAVLFQVRLLRRTDWIVGACIAYFLVRAVIMPAVQRVPFYDPGQVWAATFAIGTLWYRAYSGAISQRRAGVLTGLFAATIAAHYLTIFWFLHVPTHPDGVLPASWIMPYASFAAAGLAYATFVLLLRTRLGEGSRVLTWLGRVSYSVYLMHGVILKIPLPLSPVSAFAARLLVVLPVSALTYRFIEAPPIAWGRALTRRLGFSRRESRVSIAPMTTVSTDSPVATAEAATSTSSAPSKAVARANAPQSLVGILVAAAIAGAGGYFAHQPHGGQSFLNFDQESTPADALGPGWSGFEQTRDGDSFSWCAAKACSVTVDATKAEQFVRLRGFPYMYPGGPTQTLKVSVNGTPVGNQTLTPSPTVYQFKAPASVWKDGRNELTFEFTYAQAPKATDPASPDVRTLAAALDWVQVVPTAVPGK
ncbi:MAG TPA: acyltransferase [Polyangiaceae bacterium]|nr:acyltransferase [Polyangiaceae bacterium]